MIHHITLCVIVLHYHCITLCNYHRHYSVEIIYSKEMLVKSSLEKYEKDLFLIFFLLFFLFCNLDAVKNAEKVVKSVIGKAAENQV